MGQVESSEADESGPAADDTARVSKKPTSSQKLSHHPTPPTPQAPEGGHAGRSRGGQAGRSVGGPHAHIESAPSPRSPSSSRHRRRQNSESGSTATNLSVATDHTIPKITITECLEANDTDLDFDPAYYQTSKQRGSRDMDLSMTNHEAGGRRGSYMQSSSSSKSASATASTSGAKTGDTDLSMSNNDSGGRRNSYMQTSSKVTSSHTSSTGGVNNKPTRRRSDSSESSKSSRGSGVKKNTRKRSSEDRKKKLGLSKHDPKGSLADRWQNIVDEFEDTLDTKDDKKKGKKEEKRVSKLSMEQFDNVKQVFSKSMPLPMQMYPGPGARVEDIEADAAGVAEMAVSSYSAMSPASKRSSSASSEVIRQAEERKMSAMSSSSYGTKEARSESMVAERIITEETTREIVKKKRAADKEKEAEGEVGAVASVSHSSGMAAASASSSRGSHSSDTSKKGVKFHSKVTDLEDQARYIVDEAIMAALVALGMSDSSRSKSSGNKRSSESRTVSEKTSRTVSERRFSSEASRAAAEAEESRRMSEMHRQQSSSSSSRSKSISESKKSKSEVHEEDQYHRKASMRPKHGKQGSKGFIPPEDFPEPARAGGMRPMPGSGKTSTGPAAGGVYDMSIEHHYSEGPEPEWERKGVDVVRTSNVRVYNEEQSRDTPVYPEYIEPEVTEIEETTVERKKQSIKPPTITRGTVTRVLHEHGELMFVPTASKILSRLRSIPEEDHMNATTEYSTNTWPLSKPTEPCSENVELCTDMTYNTLPAASSVSESTEVTYNTLPAGMKLAPDWSYHDALAPTISSENETDTQQNYMITTSRLSPKLDATGLANPIDANMDRRFMLSPNSAKGPLYLDTNQMQTMFGGTLPPHLQTSVGTPVYIVSPIVSPMGPMVPGDQQGAYRMYQYDTHNSTPNIEGAAYSNEPIIVADLLEKQIPSEINVSSDYYQSDGSEHPSINMNKRQTLNFYLFNQKQQDNDKPTISYMAQGVEANIGGQRAQYMDLYMNEDAGTRQMEEVREMVTQTEPNGEEEEPFGMKEVTIFHKQTQTLPQQLPPKAPKRPKAPVVQRIERKQQQQQRAIKQPPVSPPRPSTPKEYHKETTHYITKETQIERLPPQPSPMREFSVQTDISGTLSKHRGSKVTNEGTQTLPPPLPPKQKKSSVEVTRMVSGPRVTEMREIQSTRDRPPVEPAVSAAPSPPRGRDIPLHVRPTNREDFLQTIEREVHSRQPPQYQMVAESSRKLTQPEPESESEEEIIEMYEIEEKEQRISMAIFEELEFHCSKKEGGNTTSQSAHASSASDLVPWTMPSRYETSVDRRKQKSTQIREMNKEGLHHLQLSGASEKKNPALQSSKVNSINGPGNVHQSTRCMNIQQVNDSSHPSRTITVRQTNKPSESYYEPTPPPGSFIQRSAHDPRQDTGTRRSKMVESSNIWRSAESDSARPVGAQYVEEHASSNVPSAATSSGYSSSDSTPDRVPQDSKILKDYHSAGPDLESVNESQSQNSTLKRRYVSRFDPENIYFRIPQWTSMDPNETMYNLSKDMVDGPMSPLSDESLPDSLPDNKKDNKKVTKSLDKAPKLRTRIVKDKDGNLVRITEVEQTVTKTVDYTQELPQEIPIKTHEELGCTDYMDVNLVTQEVQEIQENEVVEEEVQEIGEDSDETVRPLGPEVVEETTVEFQPVEYDIQSRTLGLQEEELRMREYEAQERTLGITDDDISDIPDQRYMYDLKTATLRPVVTKDQNGQMLMQYSIGDTMITEL